MSDLSLSDLNAQYAPYGGLLGWCEAQEAESARETEAFERLRPVRYAVQPGSLAARRKARRKRAQACRDVAVGALSFGLCAFLLVGPSVMPFPVYAGLLCAGSAATVLAIVLAARRGNPHW